MYIYHRLWFSQVICGQLRHRPCTHSYLWNPHNPLFFAPRLGRFQWIFQGKFWSKRRMRRLCRPRTVDWGSEMPTRMGCPYLSIVAESRCGIHRAVLGWNSHLCHLFLVFTTLFDMVRVSSQPKVRVQSQPLWHGSQVDDVDRQGGLLNSGISESTPKLVIFEVRNPRNLVVWFLSA